jgi:hypothetical protein
MTRKVLVIATAVALLGLSRAPLCAGQLPDTQAAAAGQIDESRKLLDADIIDNQNRLRALIAKLDRSLQAIVHAEDANGHVSDKSIVKTHEADIVTFRNAVRNQKLFLIVYEDKCGADSRQHEHIMQLQQQLKAALYDVVDTFDLYQIVNGPSSEASQTAEHILDLHREAVKEVADVLTQHEQAMAQMMRTCS